MLGDYMICDLIGEVEKLVVEANPGGIPRIRIGLANHKGASLSVHLEPARAQELAAQIYQALEVLSLASKS